MFDLIVQFRSAESKIENKVLQLLEHGNFSAMEIELQTKYPSQNNINHSVRQAVYPGPICPTY
jgi:hypothetical protein